MLGYPSKFKKKLDQQWRDRAINKILSHPHMFLLLDGCNTKTEGNNSTLLKLPNSETVLLPSGFSLYLFSVEDPEFNSETHITMLLPRSKFLLDVHLKWSGVTKRFTRLEYTWYMPASSHKKKFFLQPYFNCLSANEGCGVNAAMFELSSTKDDMFKPYKDVICENKFVH